MSEKGNFSNEAPGAMSSRTGSFRVSHIVVRFIAAASLAEIGAEEAFPAYYNAVGHGRIGSITTWFMIGAALVLPLYVVFEVWWMRKARAERRALWVDALFALVWFVVFWAGVWYAFKHSAIL